MDDMDVKILRALMENSRLSCRRIARKLGVSVATVASRMNNLEKAGIIEGYIPQLDYERMGYDIKVVIELRVARGRLLDVETRIASHPNVFAVYDITGSFDAAVIAMFKTRKELDYFLKKIQKYDFVERTETKLVLNTVKEARVLPP